MLDTRYEARCAESDAIERFAEELDLDPEAPATLAAWEAHLDDLRDAADSVCG